MMYVNNPLVTGINLPHRALYANPHVALQLDDIARSICQGRQDGAGVVRFMNWSPDVPTFKRNTLPTVGEHDQHVWDYPEWQKKSGRVAWKEYAGVPYEYQTAYANSIGAKAWYTLPILADDETLRFIIDEILRNTPTTTLRPIFEYGNEVWNTSPDFDWRSRSLIEMGNALGINKDAKPFEIRNSVYAAKTKTIIDIVNGRADVVVNCQFWGDTWTINKILDGVGNKAILAVAPYVGQHIRNADHWSDMKSIVSQIENQIEETGKRIKVLSELCKTRAIRMYAYEGGLHLVGTDRKTREQFLKINTSDFGRQLTRSLWEAWNANHEPNSVKLGYSLATPFRNKEGEPMSNQFGHYNIEGKYVHVLPRALVFYGQHIEERKMSEQLPSDEEFKKTAKNNSGSL